MFKAFNKLRMAEKHTGTKINLFYGKIDSPMSKSLLKISHCYIIIDIDEKTYFRTLSKDKVILSNLAEKYGGGDNKIRIFTQVNQPNTELKGYFRQDILQQVNSTQIIETESKDNPRLSKIFGHLVDNEALRFNIIYNLLINTSLVINHPSKNKEFSIEKVSGNCFVTNDYEKEILECGTKCEEVIGETLNGEEYLQNFIKEGPKPNITPDKIKKEYLIKEIMNETVFTNNTDFPKGTFLEKNQQSFNTLIELQKGIK